jgi:hypothetical protein
VSYDNNPVFFLSNGSSSCGLDGVVFARAFFALPALRSAIVLLNRARIVSPTKEASMKSASEERDILLGCQR